MLGLICIGDVSVREYLRIAIFLRKPQLGLLYVNLTQTAGQKDSERQR